MHLPRSKCGHALLPTSVPCRKAASSPAKAIRECP
jgi:hypothetical protein